MYSETNINGLQYGGLIFAYQIALLGHLDLVIFIKKDDKTMFKEYENIKCFFKNIRFASDCKQNVISYELRKEKEKNYSPINLDTIEKEVSIAKKNAKPSRISNETLKMFNETIEKHKKFNITQNEIDSIKNIASLIAQFQNRKEIEISDLYIGISYITPLLYNSFNDTYNPETQNFGTDYILTYNHNNIDNVISYLQSIKTK